MALINRSESLYWELMPLQGTEHWRSYIKTACDIGLPLMFFIQVVHKVGSSSQVHQEVSATHQGEAELQAGDGPATEPQQEGDGGSGEEEEGDGHTYLRVQLTRRKLMKNYLGGTKWRPMGMNVGWKRTPQMMRMTL
jgi:hypothetical protein